MHRTFNYSCILHNTHFTVIGWTWHFFDWCFCAGFHSEWQYARRL